MEVKTGGGVMGGPGTANIPCQLRFVDTPNQDTDRFHELLGERGFTPITSNPDESKSQGIHYDGELCTTDEYKRIRVIAFRGDVVRIFPQGHDDFPSFNEVGTIISAVEESFGAGLEHDPIDNDD